MVTVKPGVLQAVQRNYRHFIHMWTHYVFLLETHVLRQPVSCFPYTHGMYVSYTIKFTLLKATDSFSAFLFLIYSRKDFGNGVPLS